MLAPNVLTSFDADCGVVLRGLAALKTPGRSAWLRLHEDVKAKHKLLQHFRVFKGQLPKLPIWTRIAHCGVDPRWKKYGIARKSKRKADKGKLCPSVHTRW